MTDDPNTKRLLTLSNLFSEPPRGFDTLAEAVAAIYDHEAARRRERSKPWPPRTGHFDLNDLLSACETRHSSQTEWASNFRRRDSRPTSSCR